MEMYIHILKASASPIHPALSASASFKLIRCALRCKTPRSIAIAEAAATPKLTHMYVGAVTFGLQLPSTRRLSLRRPCDFAIVQSAGRDVQHISIQRRGSLRPM